MSLSTDDLNVVRALWEEWTADKGFRLSLEVKGEAERAIIDPRPGANLNAHLVVSRYCQVEVFRHNVSGERDERCVFSERVPCDPAALRASVTVLARTIAGWEGE